jgi:transcriptional regulator with XRE-family HTH domain
MTSPGLSVPVPVLLETLRIRVESTSLRKTANEAGLSPNAVRNLLHGARPHPATVQKLRDWFRHLNQATDKGLSLETAEAALNLLVQALPDSSKLHAAAAVLQALEAQYRREETALPASLFKLREKLEGGS